MDLDFINRPNPIEPQSVPQRHPLNGTPQLAKAHNSGLSRLLLDTNGHASGVRPARGRKSGNAQSLDLPKLPVRQNTKRLRIPPTLSGLHQPPPNAGLLPSISTEKPVVAAEPVAQKALVAPKAVSQVTSDVNVSSEELSAAGKRAKSGKPKRNRWSEEETACLLKGVSRFGIGNWTKILNCSDYYFKGRTALDLKDRFRVCCPDEYQRTSRSKSKAFAVPAAEDGKSSGRSSAPNKPVRTDRKSRAELQELGINQPFEKTRRRKRHGYSAEEDDAILKGFRKHGNAWAAIRADDDLCLEHRTATDLRDRMRTKYPEDYTKVGLTPRPDVFPKPPKRGNNDEATNIEQASNTTNDASADRGSNGSVPMAERESRAEPKQPTAKSIQQQPLLPDDSVFWGAPFDDDDLEAERVTLDRGILDWPGDCSKQNTLEHARSGGLDSLVSLRLPEPTAASTSFPLSYGHPSSALPSVAAITAMSRSGMDDQLELPSLMTLLESDGRAGGHFLGFDELLT